jgi:DNA-binding transcriptional MerR regulator
VKGDDVGTLKDGWQQHPVEPDPVEPRDPLLSIGVFARRSRLSLKALRLYDRLGLLTPAYVDEDTGYRRYRESQLTPARLVALLRRLDMPLAQVAKVVSEPGPIGAELLAAYWETVERRVANQRELVAHLRIRLSDGKGSSMMFDEIKERDVPEQLVLTEQRHVLVEELPAWLGDTISRLAESAGEHGGVAGPVFVAYHGEVNQDSDGPVEVCVPIDPSKGEDAAMPTRVEPAHREAYVRIRKAQVEYPQILSAYDAVAQWIGSRKLSVAGAPREVYFNDFEAAGPNDEVCDIAFPIE